jgi:ribosomal protein S18 acetylase RimI-like enzyme
MIHPENFKLVPWDSAAFGIQAYELAVPTPEVLKMATQLPGHYTVRVDPLSSKRWLHDCGFYYCDTLIEPYCTEERFVPLDDMDVSVSHRLALEPLLGVCHGAFSHGRFHRDFNLSKSQAVQRYDHWLAQLHAAGKVYGLLYRGELGGFIAVDGNRLVLHALAESLRGRGLAKYLWTPVCRTLFEVGHAEVTSSVSATNLAVVNLYARLGFGFRNPVDIYHRLTQ